MRKLFFIFIFLYAMSVNVWAADGDQSSQTVSTMKLSEQIYMLQGKGGNVAALTGEDGVLLIDNDYKEMLEPLNQAIQDLSSSEVKFVINTHWHGDHTGNNDAFGEEAIIVAHENIRKRLSTDQVVELFNMVSPAQPKQALPEITFEESVTIHFNGERLDIIHFPASHTDGDGVVFFRKANIVHVGDLFFNGFFPFIDLGSGGDVENYKNSVGALIDMIPEDATIIPGHGPLATLEDFKVFHQMLTETSDIVKAHIKSGKTLEEIKKVSLPEDIIEEWGDGFLSTEVWLGILYESYQ